VKSNFDYDIDFQGATWVKQRKAAKTRGITSRLLQLSVDENDGIEKRTAKIKLYDKKSSASIEVILNQLPNTPTIVPEKKEYEVDANKQNLDIKISSNVDYSVDLQGADWIKDRNAAQTRSLATSTLKLEIAKNDGYDSRTAKIKLTQKNGTASEVITITQKAKNGIEIPTKEYTIDENGDTLNIDVNSNVDYKLIINDNCKEWISELQKTRGLSSYTHQLVIKALGDNEDRTGTITISNEELKLSQTITIKQRRTLYFKKQKIFIPIGKQRTISLTNISEQGTIWTSNDENIAIVEATVANDGIVKGKSKGSAIITAKTEDGKHFATCKVKVCYITELISAFCNESSISVNNGKVENGSILSWIFKNESTDRVVLNTLQLIDGKNGTKGDIIPVNKNVDGETSVDISTTIGTTGMYLPIYCRFRYSHDREEYTLDAIFDNNDQ
jgi:uncharacterized protein YjdB